MSLQSVIDQGISAVTGAIQKNRQIKAIEGRQAGLMARSENALQSMQLRKDIAKMRHDEYVLKLANQRSKIEQELKEKQKKDFVERMKQGKIRAAQVRARTTKGE